MAFTNDYLSQIPRNDQREVLHILATHMSGAEVAFYFAAQLFYEKPSVDKAFVIYDVLVKQTNSNVSADVGPANISTPVANAVGREIARWGAHQRAIDVGAPRKLTGQEEQYMKTRLFDAAWTAVGASAGAWAIPLLETAGAGNPPKLGDMARSSHRQASAREDSMKRVLSALGMVSIYI